MPPFSDPQSPKKTIRVNDDQTKNMVAIYKHFSEAIRPSGLEPQSADSINDPLIQYMTTFCCWPRRKPRYHPGFNDPKAIQDDIDYIGFDFRPVSMSDPDLLKKASTYVWHHRAEVPNPSKLKAWMADEIDINDQAIDGHASDLEVSIFSDFDAWNRFEQFVLDQKRDKQDNFAIAHSLLAQSKSGHWTLPPSIVENCEYFLLVSEQAPNLRQIYANDYVDFARPQVDHELRPEIDLKKAVKRKKISRRQLAELQEVVIYLLPASMRVGLKGQLSETQLHYLARAGKWLRPQKHPIWKKPWTDGLDLLALMVMDKSEPLMSTNVQAVARSIEAQIDEAPDPSSLTSETAPQTLQIKQSKSEEEVEESNKQLFRRLILNPDIKHFPGTKEPKELILTRLGILRPDGFDEARIEKFEAMSEAAFERKDDPTYWLMNELAITGLLMDDAIDLDGNILADSIDVTPLLRSELREGHERQLWNKIAGLWLYPDQEVVLPDTLARYEAETLQIICAWLDKSPRRPRPFFWMIQDMTFDQFRGSPAFNGDRMRQLARFIQSHRNDPPDYERLVALKYNVTWRAVDEAKATPGLIKKYHRVLSYQGKARSPTPSFAEDAKSSTGAGLRMYARHAMLPIQEQDFVASGTQKGSHRLF